jgi:hypothetical protein
LKVFDPMFPAQIIHVHPIKKTMVFDVVLLISLRNTIF